MTPPWAAGAWDEDAWAEGAWGEPMPPVFQAVWAVNSNRTIGMEIQPE